jgi:PadR family transcriptional regulator, regulatory protein PadR
MKRRLTESVNLGEFEQLVLITAMRLGTEAYSGAIQAEIEKRGGRPASVSAVYTTLERLEIKRLVRSRVGEPTPQRGGKRKKHYEITPAGTRAVQDAYQLLKRMTKGIENLLEKAR